MVLPVPQHTDLAPVLLEVGLHDRLDVWAPIIDENDELVDDVEHAVLLVGGHGAGEARGLVREQAYREVRDDAPRLDSRLCGAVARELGVGGGRPLLQLEVLLGGHGVPAQTGAGVAAVQLRVLKGGGGGGGSRGI